MYQPFPCYPFFSSFFVNQCHRSVTWNLFKKPFFPAIQLLDETFARDKTPFGVPLSFLMHLCIRLVKFFMFGWSRTAQYITPIGLFYKNWERKRNQSQNKKSPFQGFQKRGFNNGSPSRTRTSDPMINSHAQWVNRERLQQTRIIISVR